MFSKKDVEFTLYLLEQKIQIEQKINDQCRQIEEMTFEAWKELVYRKSPVNLRHLNDEEMAKLFELYKEMAREKKEHRLLVLNELLNGKPMDLKRLVEEGLI